MGANGTIMKECKEFSVCALSMSILRTIVENR